MEKNLSEVPCTIVMDQYKCLDPTYNLIHSNKQVKSTRIYEVVINEKPTYILKQYKILTKNFDKLNEIYEKFEKEYQISNCFAKLSQYTVKILDISKIQVETDKGTLEILEILSEYGGKRLDSLDNIDYEALLDMMYQLADMLSLMESIGISHFDVKPENILWDPMSKKMKLIDFETAMNFSINPSKIMKEIDCKEVIGFSKCYAPPEFIDHYYDHISGKKAIPQKYDVYSFGMTFYVMLMIVRKRTPEIENISGIKNLLAGEECGRLISECLRKDAKDRPTFAEVKKELVTIVRRYKFISIQ